MRVKTQKCRICGYEERVEIYTREEGQKLRKNLASPCCKKCGSPNVELK